MKLIMLFLLGLSLQSSANPLNGTAVINGARYSLSLTKLESLNCQTDADFDSFKTRFLIAEAAGLSFGEAFCNITGSKEPLAHCSAKYAYTSDQVRDLMRRLGGVESPICRKSRQLCVDSCTSKIPDPLLCAESCLQLGQ